MSFSDSVWDSDFEIIEFPEGWKDERGLPEGWKDLREVKEWQEYIRKELKIEVEDVAEGFISQTQCQMIRSHFENKIVFKKWSPSHPWPVQGLDSILYL